MQFTNFFLNKCHDMGWETESFPNGVATQKAGSYVMPEYYKPFA